jgi:hypothetical protein
MLGLAASEKRKILEPLGYHPGLLVRLGGECLERLRVAVQASVVPHSRAEKSA